MSILAAALRKLKLGRTAFRLIQAFLPKRPDAMEHERAMALLLKACPDGHGSCIINRDDARQIATEAELNIIIPAYNVEKYIRACLESVLGQETKHSFRVIVIDDGSTDGTPEILRDYAGDGRVLIRRQENRGLSGARNTGIELSAAPWLTFLDSDDMLSPRAVDALMDCAADSGAAMVVGGYETMDTEGVSMGRHRQRAGRLERLEDCVGFAWGKLFRRELFDCLRFPEGYWYEDSLLAMVLYPRIRAGDGEIYGVEETATRYRINPLGISRQGIKSPRSIESLWVHIQLARDREALGLKKDQSYYEYLFLAFLLTGKRTANQPEEIRRAVFTVFADFISGECPGYKTGDAFFRYLEKAAAEKDYGRFRLLCELA